MTSVFCLAVYAAESGSVIVESLGLKSVLGSLKQTSGFKILGIVALLVQVLVLFFKFLMERLAGIYRLLIMNLLTLVVGIVFLRLQGISWVEAMIHSQTTAMAQVFFHQIIKQFLKKPKDDYAVLTKRVSL